MRVSDAQRNIAAVTGIFDVPRIATVLDVLADGRVVVDYDGNPRGPVAARCAEGLFAGPSRIGHDGAVLLFENGDPDKPMVVALLGRARAEPMNVLELKRVGAAPRECVIDGEKLVLEGRDEIVLRCGDGSITLRADGKIVLKGREIVSRAFESNRIKGSTVNIN
jgi:hypothetical protein